MAARRDRVIRRGGAVGTREAAGVARYGGCAAARPGPRPSPGGANANGAGAPARCRGASAGAAAPARRSPVCSAGAVAPYRRGGPDAVGRERGSPDPAAWRGVVGHPAAQCASVDTGHRWAQSAWVDAGHRWVRCGAGAVVGHPAAQSAWVDAGHRWVRRGAGAVVGLPAPPGAAGVMGLPAAQPGAADAADRWAGLIGGDARHPPALRVAGSVPARLWVGGIGPHPAYVRPCAVDLRPCSTLLQQSGRASPIPAL